MWDNPRLLNAAAGFLTALALMVFAVAAAQLLLRSPLFPVREILVTGELAHTTRAQIEAATRGRVTGNFFAVDLADLRAGLEALPWVRHAEVRRVWPDRLEASLVEHVALARWADGGLVLGTVSGRSTRKVEESGVGGVGNRDRWSDHRRSVSHQSIRFVHLSSDRYYRFGIFHFAIFRFAHCQTRWVGCRCGCRVVSAFAFYVRTVSHLV